MAKKHFNGGLFYTSDQQKSYIAMGKHTIKTLRKQIGMNVGKVDGLKECPRCGEIVKDWYNYCPNCGQKLRWENDRCRAYRKVKGF